MSTKRPRGWKFALIATAAVIAVLLLLRPAAAGLIMIIFIMAGLPALYRLRAYFRASLDRGPQSTRVAGRRQHADRVIGGQIVPASTGDRQSGGVAAPAGRETVNNPVLNGRVRAHEEARWRPRYCLR